MRTLLNDSPFPAPGKVEGRLKTNYAPYNPDVSFKPSITEVAISEFNIGVR